MTVVHLRPNFDLADPSTLTLDLTNPKPKDVVALVEAFEADIQSNPNLGTLPVTTGWNEITPDIAVNLLRRNRPGANRKVDPATVFYYAHQMARGEWKKTGQPMLVDSEGRLVDSQHRNYAVAISGTTITSYVVTDIEAIPHLFAYIDNARSRTPASALQTAGYNGVAPIIAKVIKIGEEVRHGVYNPSGLEKLQRMSPIKMLELAGQYPNALKASRSAASDWEEAVKYLGGRKEVVAYLGMRITDLHGEDLADNFFDEVVDSEDRANDDPIAALRKEVERDARADRPMKKHHMLAALIKVFNAWFKNETLGRRWMLQVNEDFPDLEGPIDQAAAAE